MMHIKGGRPMRSIGPSKLTNYKAEILNALTNMDSNERTNQYNMVNGMPHEEGENDARDIFNSVFMRYFPDDAHGGESVVLSGNRGPFQGGKTRRNRRRRGRRSLKRKHSRRR